MILGWIRLILMALVGLTVVYFLVSIYSRSVRREKLEKRFDVLDRHSHDALHDLFALASVDRSRVAVAAGRREIMNLHVEAEDALSHLDLMRSCQG